MRNLPVDLDEDGLTTQLEPVMKRLGIVHFICEKLRRKRFGNVTFWYRQDGEKFLEKHGQRSAEKLFSTAGRAPIVSNLKLMGANILCAPSKRPPQEFTLKTLEYRVRERENPQYMLDEVNSDVTFPLVALSCGYYTFVEEQLRYIPETRWSKRGTMRFTKRNLVVKLGSSQLIRILLNTIVDLVWFDSGSLTLTLSTVPLFFSMNSDPTNEMDEVLLSFLNVALEQGLLSRPQESTHTRICALGEQHAELVGQCLVYQFNVATADLPSQMKLLQQRGLAITRFDISIPSGLRLNTAGFTQQMNALKSELGEYAKDASVPFMLLFQLQALAMNAYLLPTVVLELSRALRKETAARRNKGQILVPVDAMRRLFDTIDWPSPYAGPAEFEIEHLLQAIYQNEEELKQGNLPADGVSNSDQSVAHVCHVTVTPSRMTLHGPELEPKNRILRKFPNHHEYFIRAQFCDENGQDLIFSPRVDNSNIFTRFKAVLRDGIKIGGRIYSFLGFSHSSLRAHSVWFSAPFFDDNGQFQTYFTIIKAVGNFSKITSPARCAARIGQAFSETPFAVNLEQSNVAISRIPDVKSPDGSRVFSDGIGAVSQNVVDTIWENLPRSKGFPTCFQIRLGGAKGMLALDSRLQGSVIQLRPSMIKFPSEDMSTLEICDVGWQPIPLVLNRQMIKIMEDMGVSQSWFFKLQSIQVNHLREITTNVQHTAKYIKRQNMSRCLRLHRLFQQLGLLQIDYKNDSFLRSVVEALVLHELRLLKYKARIPVELGVTLFGIMDETGFLQENEVFVTFERRNGPFIPPPGPGPLLVTRSPALFDGDIQTAINTVPPADHPLAKHRNCIVFSRRGSRDLPSQLSGGDLDGDIFNIIWDPECAPVSTYPPADYPRLPPVDIGRPVTTEDMAEFFVKFMETDRLGVIATRHVILADQVEEGSHHPDCKFLAQLHSTAVDFSKTGIPVEMGHLPKMKSRFRPDFLAPGPQVHIFNKSDIEVDDRIVQTLQDEDEGIGPAWKYYASEKVLGGLYRSIDEKRIWREDVKSSKIPSKIPFWEDFMVAIIQKCETFGPISWSNRIDEARFIRVA
ncbi:uncharacterized protein N7482_002777 [Penicillium canariense]|uniref:RNA-dependent RNA polymerase n=1 Tax=Penicillium canariense TaxID=189055 RepID=A0A9W9LUT5_9EURO|nr:uncharacterized protein N7482_002777 [Penicillium canariense]KAJ5176900.1 hypothetical protein N7482_002777 [Penicillium canariense]